MVVVIEYFVRFQKHKIKDKFSSIEFNIISE